MCHVRTVKVCKRNKISHILWHASFRSHICRLLRVWQPLPAVELYNNFFSNLENLIKAINSSLLNVTESVSQLGSQSVSDKHCQWSDSGPIKRRIKIWCICFLMTVFTAHDLSNIAIYFKGSLHFLQVRENGQFSGARLQCESKNISCALIVSIVICQA